MVAKTKGSDMGDGLAGLCFNSALVVSGGDAAQPAAKQAGLRQTGARTMYAQAQGRITASPKQTAASYFS